MSVNPFSKPLMLEIKPSLQKSLLLIIPHILTLLIVISVKPFPVSFRFILATLVLLSTVYFFRLHFFKSLKNSVNSISQDSAKNWLIFIKDNEQKEVELLGSSFVSNMLIIINYIDINYNKYNVIIAPDSLSSDEFRRLIVRIKMT